ncbi:MAG: sigma-70 family RNA polymerase sigma factor [Chloroflexota bacterium]
MDEAELIQYARGGDLDAFNRLVLTYQDIAFNVAYGLMSDPAEAEDVTQDAFVSAYRKLDSFRGGSFKAWLLRIVTNAGYDALRKRKRQATTPLEPLSSDDEEIESPIWLTDPSESPEDTTARIELGMAIQQCMDAMALDYKTVVILVDVQGMDYAEVAEVVGSPLGTIKSRLARARLKMQQCLQGAGELLPSQYRFEEERS